MEGFERTIERRLKTGKFVFFDRYTVQADEN